MRSFTPFSLLVPAVFVVLVARFARADDAFVGCYYDDDNWIEATTDQTTPDACNTQCKDEGYTFSGWINLFNPQCYCRNDFPQTGLEQDGNLGSCPIDTYDIRVTSTTFGLIGCFASNSITYKSADTDSIYSVNDPKGCFYTCAHDYVAVFYQSSNSYYCHCATYGLSDLDDDETCGPSAQFVYTHTAAAQASGYARRDTVQELKSRSNIVSKRSVDFCPGGKTACSIPGSTTDYECIDTISDLESCGGCVYGEYQNTTSLVGQDCTASGAALGGATCLNGQCLITSCRPPLTLQDGECVAKHKTS